VQVNTPQGLSATVAAQRLAAEGPNELPQDRSRGVFGLLFELAREPMILLLIAAAGLYALIGDARESITLAASVVFMVAITFAQEWKTERALRSLKDLSSPRAQVIRDGSAQRIPGRDVVRGDWVVLAEGDRVPADGEIIDAQNALLDESILTGESVPVQKMARRTGDSQDNNRVFSGTLLVRGRIMFEVSSTGKNAELGKIGQALADIENEASPLQKQIGTLVRVFGMVGIGACFVLVLWIGLTRGDWIAGLLAGLALAISMMPEEFPVILTVFLALGAFRMSRRHVLARRMAAVEALGAVSVLCVNKTGTLTENRMRIAALWTRGDEEYPVDATAPVLPERVHEVVEYGILSSQRDPFDPMERAFAELGRQTLTGTEHLHDTWQLVREYPLSPELLSISHVWRAPDGAALVVAAKGAPEAIVDLCHVSEDETSEILARASAMAEKGLRVLGVARAMQKEGPLPEIQHDFVFSFVGLVGLADPLRAEVPAAVQESKEAGVRIIMITGDYVQTARTIGKSAGIDTTHVLTGAELRTMSDDTLAERLARTSIIARAVPEDKLRIVRALKKSGAVVAMTGDGVNDAPALKAAHVGIAMGGRGTDVARESAGLVLTDDNFASILEGIRLGRRIFDNIRRATSYVLSVHVAIAGAALVPALLGWPLSLLPIHIVFLELIIDPACSIAFEAEPGQKQAMQKPPRAIDTPILSRARVGFALLQGAVLLLAVLAVLFFSRARGHNLAITRALAFSTLIVGNLALIVVNRSISRPLSEVLPVRNRAVWVIVAATLLLLVMSLVAPPLQALFHFSRPPTADLLGAALTGIVSVLWIDILKRRRAPNQPNPSP